MKKIITIFLVLFYFVSLACSTAGNIPFLSTPTPTPTLTSTATATPTMSPTPTLTPTPTVTSTPGGEIVTEPKKEFSLYIPNGFSAYCDKGVCIVSQDSSGYYKGMWFNYVALPSSYSDSERELFYTLFMNGMLNWFEQLSVFAKEKSDAYEVEIGGMDGFAIDFTGEAGSARYPIEGQIVTLSPNPTHIFWSMAWVETTSSPGIWHEQGENIFHFILNSATMKQ